MITFLWFIGGITVGMGIVIGAVLYLDNVASKDSIKGNQS